VTIAILDHGSGNLHSVSRAIEEVGGKPEVTGDAGAVMAADALLVPGVGRFRACVRALAERGLDETVRRFAATGRPVFGVCLGMQVFFERSEEDPDPGLGLLAGGSSRLPEDVKVPHIGWNTVEWVAAHPYVADIPSGTHFYFVHSFAPDVGDDTVGITEHGRPFASVVARDNLFATQFHPEKSGDAGLRIYERFVREAAS